MLLNPVFNIDSSPPDVGAGAVEYFLATNATLQSLTVSVVNEIVLGTEVYDSATVFASNRFVVPSGMDGYYAILNAGLVLNPERAELSLFEIQVSTDGGSSWDYVAGRSIYDDGYSTLSAYVLLAENDIYRAAFTPGASSQDISEEIRVYLGGIMMEPIA